MRRFVYVIFFAVILVACQKAEEPDLISKLQGNWLSYDGSYIRCDGEYLTVKANKWTVNRTCSDRTWVDDNPYVTVEETYSTTATILENEIDKFTLQNVIQVRGWEIEEREGTYSEEKVDITYYIQFHSKDEFVLTKEKESGRWTWTKIQ